MKLCIIGNPNSAHVRRWCKIFLERGHAVYLIGEHVLELSKPECTSFHDLTRLVNIPKLRFAIWGAAVRRIVGQLQPDVVHTQGASGAGWLGAASGFHPFLVTALGSDLHLYEVRSWQYQRLTSWVLRKADYLACNSEKLVEKALMLGVPHERVESIFLGIDTEVFHPSANRHKIRDRLNMGQGPIVLSIRAMNTIYNPLDTARAIPLVLAQVPETRFYIFTYNSDPQVFERFKALTAELGVEHAVTFVGSQESDSQVADYYQAADVCISIPSSDGTPSSVLEALSCGAGLVLSDLPSLHDWVRHEHEGLFVPVNDVNALSEAIVRLLKDDELRGKVTRSAVEKISLRGDRKVYMDRYEELYRSLAATGGKKVSLS